MKHSPNIDGVLIQWGDRLFYPGNRIVKPTPQPRLKGWRGAGRAGEHIMLSMPRGSADPLIVERAAREFAQAELSNHKCVMVLHDHQANPHVHISVRAESIHGKRLNPRKVDLHRWRETFAEKLRGSGIDAEASRQATRGRHRNYDELSQVKAREDARLIRRRATEKTGARAEASRVAALEAWQ